MSYQTDANILYDELKKSLTNLESQLKDYQYIMSEILSNNTNGSNEWSDDFRNSIINLQKIFFDLAYSINKLF